MVMDMNIIRVTLMVMLMLLVTWWAVGLIQSLLLLADSLRGFIHPKPGSGISLILNEAHSLHLPKPFSLTFHLPSSTSSVLLQPDQDKYWTDDQHQCPPPSFLLYQPSTLHLTWTCTYPDWSQGIVLLFWKHINFTSCFYECASCWVEGGSSQKSAVPEESGHWKLDSRYWTPNDPRAGFGGYWIPRVCYNISHVEYSTTFGGVSMRQLEWRRHWHPPQLIVQCSGSSLQFQN